MVGYITYGEGAPAKGVELGEKQFPGAVFASLRMGQARHPGSPLARRGAVLAARQLKGLGVRTAVFPVDFPYSSLFIREGVYPVDTLPLRRALAAPLAKRRLEALGLGPTQAVAAVSGSRASQETAEAAKSLALSYRYVLLSVRSGGEELARSLRREYGISLLLSPTVEQLERADALLLFAPRGDLTGNNPIYYTLYPGGEAGRGRLPLALPPALAGRVEDNCDREQLAAAVYAQGGITLEQVLGASGP